MHKNLPLHMLKVQNELIILCIHAVTSPALHRCMDFYSLLTCLMVFFFQLPVHPVNDEFIQYILSLAFKHFKQRDSYASSPAATNGEYVAALYAEVLGTLAHACFLPVRKRFTAEFKEHQNNPSSFVNIIYGMKYLRIKVCRPC